VTVFRSDAHLRRDQHGIAVVPPIAFLHPANDLTLHAYHRCGRVLFTSANMRNFPELPGIDPAVELLSDSSARGFSQLGEEKQWPAIRFQ
jgi:hypothetical protein